jgi:hypothetical protein
LLSPSLKAETDNSMSAFTLDSASFSLGVAAPTDVNVGSGDISKGTLTYRTSVGTSDNFSVGTVSSMGATSSASSTPDYDVLSNAAFDIASTSTIQQAIGSLQIGDVEESTDPVTSEVTKTTSYYSPYYYHYMGGGDTEETTTTTEAGDTTSMDGTGSASGSISGSFEKTFASNGDTTNNVTVDGVGTNTNIDLGDTASFSTQIAKVGSSDGISTAIPDGGSAGTANGSANGSVNTSTSAAASNSQFVSSFIQAY